MAQVRSFSFSSYLFKNSTLFKRASLNMHWVCICSIYCTFVMSRKRWNQNTRTFCATRNKNPNDLVWELVAFIFVSQAPLIFWDKGKRDRGNTAWRSHQKVSSPSMNHWITCSLSKERLRQDEVSASATKRWCLPGVYFLSFLMVRQNECRLLHGYIFSHIRLIRINYALFWGRNSPVHSISILLA